MPSGENQEVDALVISGQDGAVYAVPLPLLEKCRLPEELAARVREEDGVQGYIIIVGGHQALGTAQFTIPGGFANFGKEWGALPQVYTGGVVPR
jgi:hypothetical protein